MNKVLVLMSTYNGEKYLRDQLDSILNQKQVDFSLCVRDDGSKDNTISIINEYMNQYPEIKLYTGENLKPAKSFMWLVENCQVDTFEYFAFCDQDDVWLDDKLMCATNKLDEHQDAPALYYCATQNVTSDLDKLDILFTDSKHTSSLVDSIATGSLIPGCTMVFNRKLMDLLRLHSPQNLTMHDTWVHLVCLSCGGIVISDNVPHILYRQHENNVLGAKKKTVKFRMLRFKKLKREYSLMTTEIFDLYNTLITESSKKVLSLYSGYFDDFGKKILIVKTTINSNLRIKDKALHISKIVCSKF